jgi:hypothetical protein
MFTLLRRLVFVGLELSVEGKLVFADYLMEMPV